MIARNANFQSRSGVQKQTRGAGRQLLLHLRSLGTPPETPPFPVPSKLAQGQIQIQRQGCIQLQKHKQSNYSLEVIAAGLNL